ncbi:rhomboid family intramembrane serine protease [Flavobacterium kingsejongi]|uniref:Rhomboid family intramembrane serine protease n=1 Tax=Flavobacterium kingsejongi TaxID=1678728 RepID=A0A2S1LNJ8_9FLAO|nr:rhomboid family intramembrane serine protease [Flavobacterium kingsejongi]AWG25304.1 rhomboid family intramembrane serine protease [Flavobacterium kingsejongi]
MADHQFKFSTSVIGIPLFFVLSLWIVFWIEVQFKIRLSEFGIYPRTFEGLRGIFFSPFLHGDIEHLYNNSIPLLILLGMLRYFYRKQSLRVIVYGILLSGFITWVIGRENYHIGASGLIYVLVSFIFFKGILTKYYRLVALSFTIILIYGGIIWYIFPGMGENISWEGHLGGLITGLLFAFIFKTEAYQKEVKYDWEAPDFDPQSDPFMSRFDEQGNFIYVMEKTDPEEYGVIYDYIENSIASETLEEELIYLPHSKAQNPYFRNKEE